MICKRISVEEIQTPMGTMVTIARRLGISWQRECEDRGLEDRESTETVKVVLNQRERYKKKFIWKKYASFILFAENDSQLKRVGPAMLEITPASHYRNTTHLKHSWILGFLLRSWYPPSRTWILVTRDQLSISPGRRSGGSWIQGRDPCSLGQIYTKNTISKSLEVTESNNNLIVMNVPKSFDDLQIDKCWNIWKKVRGDY